MSFEEIIVYGIALFVIVRILLFLRGIYKNRIRKVIFPKKVSEEEQEENKRNNELYQEKKQKELLKRQEEQREKYKDDEGRAYKEDLEIVDVAKPVGKWTRMVMLSGGLMKRLAQLIRSEGNKKGFWELFIKAQSSTKGKRRGKGR
ncbi:rho GDP-dissociation inhibitor [Wolbachia endosymbiont of Ctenocephalides felis wCfeT]|uniref:hypothetical protein n=1 Tax=Wolbachia endosymbiont of Ctenocephalides felis wCfeT TaxID=2732593 RepID=UPI0014477A1E|nr:hypothetical protein [Wolbachia endosymbiont of Ctenocephalides felis wCfeT]